MMGGYGGFLVIIVVVGLLLGFRQTSQGLTLPLIGVALLGGLYAMFGGLDGQEAAQLPAALILPEGAPRIVTEQEMISASMGIAFVLGLLAGVHRIFGWLAGFIFGALIGFVLAEHYVVVLLQALSLVASVEWLASDATLALTAIAVVALPSLALLWVLGVAPFAAGLIAGALIGFTMICVVVIGQQVIVPPVSFVFLMIFETVAPGKAPELTLFAAMMLSSVAMMGFFGVAPFAAGWLCTRFARVLVGR